MTESERETPANLDAEMAVLGAVMIDPETMKSLAGLLEPKDFYRELHQWIWEAALSLHREGKSCDQVSVLIWMKEHDRKKCGILASTFDPDGRHYLSVCVQMCTSVVFAKYWAETVKDCSERRQTIIAANRMAEGAYKGTGKPSKRLRVIET